MWQGTLLCHSPPLVYGPIWGGHAAVHDRRGLSLQPYGRAGASVAPTVAFVSGHASLGPGVRVLLVESRWFWLECSRVEGRSC